MTTIHVNASPLAGETLTAKVYRRDTGALVNGAGDAMTEGVTGHFTFDLAESRTGLGILRVDIHDSVGITGDPLFLHEDDTVCRVTDTEITTTEPTGARTVTITVNDGATALQNALVRVTQGAESYTGLTNASGVVTFNLDDATWTISITKSGYSYTGTTLVVDGTETVTYSMTEVDITPGTGNLTTGYLTVLDDEGVAEAGVPIYVKFISAPSGDTGYGYDTETRTVTSDVNGLVQITGLVKGAKYKIYRGEVSNYPITIPANAGNTYELVSIIGREV